MIKRYKIADGWAEMKETTSQDARWVKWADLQAYFTREDVRELTEWRNALMSLTESEKGSSHARWVTSLRDRIAALLP